MLFLARFNFVATQAFLGFNVENVLSQYWIVLAQTQFARGVLCVLDSVVVTVATFFRHQTNNLSLALFLSHYFLTSLFLGIIHAITKYANMPGIMPVTTAMNA